MAYDDAARTARFLELLRPVHDRVRLTARRLARSNADGDDLFQETVLRALDRMDELRQPERFANWLYVVLLNVHRTRHRRRFWRRMLPLAEAGVEPGRAGDAEKIEGAERMARALAALPAEQREAVVLFEIEGFTLEEVAGLQRTSIAAVKSRVVRARARLRRHYDREERVLAPVAKEWT
jgi:RNA polymerase sigma-70 factor (ECF subfamily)